MAAPSQYRHIPWKRRINLSLEALSGLTCRLWIEEELKLTFAFQTFDVGAPSRLLQGSFFPLLPLITFSQGNSQRELPQWEGAFGDHKQGKNKRDTKLSRSMSWQPNNEETLIKYQFLLHLESQGGVYLLSEDVHVRKTMTTLWKNCRIIYWSMKMGMSHAK